MTDMLPLARTTALIEGPGGVTWHANKSDRSR